MAAPSVSESLPSFEIWPKKTFFGLDKSSGHCFTLHQYLTKSFTEYFSLGSSFLQENIFLQIGQSKFPAQVRLVRMDRRNPSKLQKHDIPTREIIQFQWKKNDSTIKAIREMSDLSFQRIQNKLKNNVESIHFHHIGGNEFLLVNEYH